MRKHLMLLFLCMSLCLCITITISASAQDYIYLEDENLYRFNISTTILRTDASLWDKDFRYNPALLDTFAPFEIIYDIYYLGSYNDVSTTVYGRWDTGFGFIGDLTGSSDVTYISNSVGTDIGFVKEISNMSSLAAVFNYKYYNLKGDGAFTTYWTDNIPPALTGHMVGTSERKINSHTVGLTLLYDIDFNDDFSLGVGLKYSYFNEKQEYDITGKGIDDIGIAEDLRINKENVYSYHLISPTLGLSLRPFDKLVIDSYLSAGFYMGTIDKKSTIFDNYWDNAGVPPPSNTYTEDLTSNKLSGWEINCGLETDYMVSDSLSIPFFIDFSYRDMLWEVGGTASGWFTSWCLLSPSTLILGPGTIFYKSDGETWDVEIGAGLEYKIGGFDFSAIASYTRWESSFSFYRRNSILGIWLAYFERSTTETRDILSIEFGAAKEFNQKLSVDFNLLYNVGWGRLKYYENEAFSPPPINAYNEVEGKDTYHDLGISFSLSYSPMEKLTISCAGMVKIPLNSIDYNLTGESKLLPTGILDFYGGPSTIDYNLRGWDYGGMLNIKYEF